MLEVPPDADFAAMRLFVPRMGPDRREMFPIANLDQEYRDRVKREHMIRVGQAIINREVFTKRAAGSEAFQRQLLAMCRRDAPFFFDHFLQAYDDRDVDEPEKPFVPYTRQREIIRYYAGDFSEGKGRKVWFIEKSRAIGASWILAGCSLWSWLFRDGDSTLWGAVLKDDVDDGGQGATLKSHFGRIRFLLSRLPEWMRPPSIEKEEFNKSLTIRHPQKRQNVIQGKQFGPNLGRGPRYTRCILDECAHSPDFEAAMSSLSQTTRRTVMNSTPRGRDNASARLRFSGMLTRLDTISWETNPTLDGARWYCSEARHLTPETRASELDISYDLSAANRVFKAFDPSVNVSDVEYDPALPLHVAVDPGLDDPCAILWIQPSRTDKTFNIVDDVHYSGKTGEWFVPLLLGYVPSHTRYGIPWSEAFDYDEMAQAIIKRHGVWGPIDEMYGGADGDRKTQVADHSLFDLWFSYGIARRFGGIIAVKHDSKDEAVRAAEIVLPRVRIARRLDSQRTQGQGSPTLVECFFQYEWAERESPTGRKMTRQPKHNIFCHAMDAWQIYLAGKQEDPVDSALDPLPPDMRAFLAGVPDDTGVTGSCVPQYEPNEVNGG